MQAKPFQVWAQERAAAEAAADRKMREAAMGSQAMSQGLAALAPQPPPTIHKPTHDWDRSAMFAAERAAGLEKMDKQAAIDRENETFKLQLRARFAPKKGGGAGPVSKLAEKYLKTFDETPQDETHAERRRAELRYLREQMARYGGGKVLADLDKAGMAPEQYKAVGKHGMTKELKAVDTAARQKSAEEQAAERRDIEQARILAGAAKPPQSGFERPEDKAAREQRLAEAQRLLNKKRKVTAPGGEVYTVEDEE